MSRVNFTKEDIGGEILPILTTGLYRDTLDALREYVQNAVDAESNRIEVVIDPDTVSVKDNGVGMNRDEARGAMRLGISDKNPLENVGFRGIGVYSGFNLCDLLEIYTKSAKDETVYRLHFDFKRVRFALLEEQERRSTGLQPKLFLERLLEEAVFVDEADTNPVGQHGSMVIMSGLLPDAYRRLNDWEEVTEYLQNVVPLPFNPEFRYGPEIEEKFRQADYRVVRLTLQIGNRMEPLYRPYTNRIFARGGVHPPQFFDIKSGKQHFGFAWVCVNDAREAIKDTKIRGLLIKKFGFSISDRQYLEPYFGRPVFSRRTTGEVIIQHPNLIPNAARSDFENNATRQLFLETLPKLTRSIDSWANKIQEEERAREVLAELSIRLAEINEGLPALQRDRESLLKLNAELDHIQRRLKQQKRLATVDEAGLERAREQLGGAQDFVKEALLSQKKARQKLQEEVVAAIQRKEELQPTPDEKALTQSIPQNLIAVLDDFGLIEGAQIRRVLEIIDAKILKAYLEQDDYDAAIRELRSHLEEEL